MLQHDRISGKMSENKHFMKEQQHRNAKWSHRALDESG